MQMGKFPKPCKKEKEPHSVPQTPVPWTSSASHTPSAATACCCRLGRGRRGCCYLSSEKLRVRTRVLLAMISQGVRSTVYSGGSPKEEALARLCVCVRVSVRTSACVSKAIFRHSSGTAVESTFQGY